MSENVINFRPKEPPPEEPAYIIEFYLHLDKDGELIRTIGNGPNQLGEHYERILSRALWAASWWHGIDHTHKFPDDPEAILSTILICRGSRVTVYTPPDSSDDAFTGEERLSWLKRRLDDAYELVRPSSSAEEPASGTTSQSHSANLDQLQFSW